MLDARYSILDAGFSILGTCAYAILLRQDYEGTGYGVTGATKEPAMTDKRYSIFPSKKIDFS